MNYIQMKSHIYAIAVFKVIAHVLGPTFTQDKAQVFPVSIWDCLLSTDPSRYCSFSIFLVHLSSMDISFWNQM